MGIVSTGEFTIVDVNDGLNARLTLDSIAIPTKNDGSGGDFSPAVTTMSIWIGSTDDSANWTVSATPSMGLTGSLNGKTYTVTNLANDAGYVDLTARRPGFGDVITRFAVTKAKAGVIGPAISITQSKLGFTFTDNVAQPAEQTIEVSVIRNNAQTGDVYFYASNGKQLETDRDKQLMLPYTFGLPSTGRGDTCYVKLSDLGSDQQLYVTAVLGELTAVASIIRLDFSTAAPGATRNVFRGAWETGQAYSIGDSVVFEGAGWQATTAHVANVGNQPPSFPATSNANWAQAAAKGDRGTLITAYAIAGSAWSDADANTSILLAGGVANQKGDVVTLHRAAIGFSQTRVWTGTFWNPLAAFYGGDVLVDGTVTALKIGAGEVKTGNLDANAVTTAKIAAGAVGADQIAANAVVASKMLVSDRENLWADGTFDEQNVANYIKQGGASGSILWNTANAKTGAVSMEIKKTTLAESIYVHNAPQLYTTVIAGEKYWAETEARTLTGTATAGFYFRVRWFTNAKVYISYDDVASNVGLTTTWTSFTAQVTAPTNAAFAGIELYNHSTNTVVGSFLVDRYVLRRANAGKLIVDGEIKGNHLDTQNAVIKNTAQIENGIITEAKILGTLNANKIAAGTALANTITVDGTTLATVQSRAADPAARINAHTVKIDPGKITISGATTLQDWRNGTDATLIEGGKLAANTVSANKLEIGSRNITIKGITFDYNMPTANKVSWTAGTIDYINDAGTPVTVAIAAGELDTAWTSGTRYITWTKDQTTLSNTSTLSTALGPTRVILATYEGGNKLVVDYGKTIIDGGSIKTDTITATQIAANAVTSDKIAAQSITATKMLLSDTTNMWPDFDNYDLSLWSSTSGHTITQGGSGATDVGRYFLKVANTGTAVSIESAWQSCEAATDYVARGVAYQNSSSGGATSSLYIEFASMTSGGVITPTRQLLVGSKTNSSSAAPYDLPIITESGERRFRFIATRSAAGTQDLRVASLQLLRRSNARLIVEGSITTQQLAADVLHANNITTGQMSVARLNVDTLLNVDAANGGIAVGKASAYAPEDGIYMGRTTETDQSVGFGVAASRTVAGVKQSFEVTKSNGLKLNNASFFRNFSIPGATTTYTTGQQINLTAGIGTFTVQLIGGGGGGAAASGTTNGGNGTTTTVQLRDGTTVLQTWTSPGGLGGVGTPKSSVGTGGASAFGPGGAAGYTYNRYYQCTGGGEGEWCQWYTSNATNGSAAPATSYGAGGGGGGGTSQGSLKGAGGSAAQVVEIAEYSVAGIASPNLLITVGTGGAGVSGSMSGAAGAGGCVKVTQNANANLRADVIPLEPTARGSFNTGSPFPNLGAGLWIINAQGSNNISGGKWIINDMGDFVSTPYGSSVAFISTKTPVLSGGNYANRTVDYHFHKMGQ